MLKSIVPGVQLVNMFAFSYLYHSNKQTCNSNLKFIYILLFIPHKVYAGIILSNLTNSDM